VFKRDQNMNEKDYLRLKQLGYKSIRTSEEKVEFERLFVIYKNEKWDRLDLNR
jgi:hypothetical protein